MDCLKPLKDERREDRIFNNITETSLRSGVLHAGHHEVKKKNSMNAVRNNGVAATSVNDDVPPQGHVLYADRQFY